MQRYREKKTGRVVVVTDTFNDGGEDHGYEYHFEDAPTRLLWIGTTSAAVRWEKLNADDQRTDA